MSEFFCIFTAIFYQNYLHTEKSHFNEGLPSLQIIFVMHFLQYTINSFVPELNMPNEKNVDK